MWQPEAPSRIKLPSSSTTPGSAEVPLSATFGFWLLLIALTREFHPTCLKQHLNMMFPELLPSKWSLVLTIQEPPWMNQLKSDLLPMPGWCTRDGPPVLFKTTLLFFGQLIFLLDKLEFPLLAWPLLTLEPLQDLRPFSRAGVIFLR